MAYRRVAEVADVPSGRGLRVCVGRVPIGIYRVRNAWFAMEDTCPHAGGALSAGTLNDTIVTCPVHAYDYDLVTGFRPGYEDGFPIPRFPVRIEDGGVYIDIELGEEDA